MRFHVLDRTFERIPNTTVVRVIAPGTTDHHRGIDLSDYSYDPMPNDAQVLALIIGLTLKGVI